jgi:D-arginine dehydrogenase
MAGASLAAELAAKRSVVLLEIEDQPGCHATGRSAAMFFESYGNAAVRALTRASRSFLALPPAGFADVPLLTPRGSLIIADAGQLPRLDRIHAEARSGAAMLRLDSAEALVMVPILRAEAAAGAWLDQSGHDIDVAALLQGYLRVARRNGARLVMGAAEMAACGLCGRASGNSAHPCSSTPPAPGPTRWPCRRAQRPSACNRCAARR